FNGQIDFFLNVTTGQDVFHHQVQTLLDNGPDGKARAVGRATGGDGLKECLLQLGELRLLGNLLGGSLVRVDGDAADALGQLVVHVGRDFNQPAGCFQFGAIFAYRIVDDPARLVNHGRLFHIAWVADDSDALRLVVGLVPQTNQSPVTAREHRHIAFEED